MQREAPPREQEGMLTHIVTLGASADALAEKLTQDGLSAAPLAADSPLPAGTVAAVGDADGAGALAAVASAIGARHEASLMLVAMALSVREGTTADAVLRKRKVANLFAQALGLSAHDAHAFERGALLHDIGKLELPNELLLSGALLSHDDWERMRQYPALGATLCSRTPGLEDLAEIIGGHQECYDGTGYPQGLERDAIPPLARALRLVNVYCAMTSPRSYRAGHASPAEAMAFIESELGKHFDPDLGKVFLGLALDSQS